MDLNSVYAYNYTYVINFSGSPKNLDNVIKTIENKLKTVQSVSKQSHLGQNVDEHA